MADQLLSQADVDALVSSLTRSEPAKPVTPAPQAAAKATSTGATPKPASVPVTRAQTPASMPVTAAKAAQPGGGMPVGAAKPAQSGGSPAARPVQPARQENRAEVSAETVNAMNAKIAELSKQLAQMGAAMKRIELLERKAAELENKVARNSETPATTQRVQELSEAVKKISNNLKGTPGYGVKNTFTCEKCSDHGHVAVMYKCTSCGRERWYGWWPEKK
jgi:hypothetical protein